MNYAHTPWSNLFNLLPAFVRPGVLPPEIDVDFYKLVHEDMRGYSDDELRAHFLHHGRREGRIVSPAAHRIGFLACIDKETPLLEIGPFTKPGFVGPNVKYFDVLDRDELLLRASKVGYPTESCPHIDYVSPTADLGIVDDESFSAVFSSHCIEHQPDLISHLQHVSRILKQGGSYYLIIPDKRYCFDHFLDISNIEEILRAHEERRKVHVIKSIYEHYVLTTHSNTIDHWNGLHDDPNYAIRAERAKAAIDTFHNSKGQYVDVHAWQFTPQGLKDIITKLSDLGLIDLEVSHVYETVWGQNEFTAVLKKTN
jgi:SAM-dependent methyltransferase